MKYCALALAALALGIGSVASAQELSRSDKIHIAVQEICPITGERLGGHGTPFKVRIGEETVFVCCKGCLKDPVDPKHWATIHANFARAQRICPIMKHDLPDKPKWTIVEGQIVYVCCPPCTKKIAEDPQAVLRQIDELYLASLQQRQARR